MNNPEPPVNESKLDALLAEVVRRRESGEQVDVESICAVHPDLAESLRSYFRGEELLKAMAADVPASRIETDASQAQETIRPGAARRTDLDPTRPFGRYVIIRQLGEGAMGAVYLAENQKLGRRVALKLPKLQGLEGSEFVQRFYREARAAAALKHPNLCQVFDADEVDGTPYIAMEYLDGQPLSRYVGTKEYLDQRRVATVLRDVALGLAHCHDAGLLHRDLKPGNVIIREDGSPCVTDFGLARSVDDNEESRITREGTILGTPAYMSPEQIEGDPQKIGPAADIYSLGVMLYELLTGQLPFRGSLRNIISQALNKQPERPSKIRSTIHTGLEDLCLSMLEKEASRRPASMQSVADTLENWLQHTAPEAVAKRQKSDANREKLEEMKAKILDLAQRGQFAASVAGLEKMVALTIPGATDYVAWAKQKLPEIKAMPQQLRENAPTLVATAKKFMKIHDYAQAADLITQIPLDFRSEVAQRLLDEAIELQDESDLLLMDLKECVRKKQYDGIEGNLKRFLELKPGNRFAKELQESLKSYARAPGRQRSYRFDKKGNLLPYAEDHTWKVWLGLSVLVGLVVFGVAYQYITIYLRSENRTLAVQVDKDWLDQQGGQLSLMVDGNKHTISGPGLNVTVTIGKHDFSVQSGDTVVHNPQHFEIVKNDARVLIIDGNGMHLQTHVVGPDPSPTGSEPPSTIVDAPRTPLPDGEPGLVATLKGHKDRITALAVSPDGKLLASADWSRDEYLWNLSTQQILRKLEEPEGTGMTQHFQFLRSGSEVVGTGPGGAVRKFDVRTGRKMLSYAGHTSKPEEVSNTVDSLSILSDGEHFFTVSRNGTVANWHVDRADPDQYLDLTQDSGMALVGIPVADGILLANHPWGTPVTLHDWQTGRQIKVYDGINGGSIWTDNNRGHFWHLDGGTIRKVSVTTGQVIRSLVANESLARAVLSPDGRYIVAGGGQPHIYIWNVESGAEVYRADTPCPARVMTVTPDGRFLIFGSPDEKDNSSDVHIWRLPKEVWPKLTDPGTSTAEAPPSATDNLISNGSFETPVVTKFRIGIKEGELPRWRIVKGDVDIGGNYYWKPAEGNQCLDLNGTAPATIEQAVATAPGQHYQVSFKTAGYQQWTKRFRVSWNGTTLEEIEVKSAIPEPPSGGPLDWKTFSYDVTATGTESILRFEALTAENIGPLIDDVVVKAVAPQAASGGRAVSNEVAGDDYLINVDYTKMRDQVLKPLSKGEEQVIKDGIMRFSFPANHHAYGPVLSFPYDAVGDFDLEMEIKLSDLVVWWNLPRIGTSTECYEFTSLLTPSGFKEVKNNFHVRENGGWKEIRSVVQRTSERPGAGRGDWVRLRVQRTGRDYLFSENGNTFYRASDNNTRPAGYNNLKDDMTLWLLPANDGPSSVEIRSIRMKRLSSSSGSTMPAAKPSTTAGPLPRQKPMALHFNGSAWVEVPKLKYVGNLPLTLEAIVCPEKVHKQAIIANFQDSGFGLQLDTDRHWEFVFHDVRAYKDARSDSAAQIGVPVHVAAVFDAKEISLFVNGVRQSNDDRIFGTHRSSKFHFFIVADPDAAGRPERHWNGYIYGARVSQAIRYKRDFTPPPSLDSDYMTFAAWDFTKEASGSTFPDLTGRGLDAVSYNTNFREAPAWNPTPSN